MDTNLSGTLLIISAAAIIVFFIPIIILSYKENRDKNSDINQTK